MSDETDRRERVLAIALATFARYGYKKTSMEDIARAADISRPGLYFLFAAKQQLFRAAVTQALEGDVAAAERSLTDRQRPLRDRLIEAFDFWTGRYVGSMAAEVAVLMETNPELLGGLVTEYPRRFREMVTAAVEDEDVARTLISIARGIKHEVASREEYNARMTVGVDLLLSARPRAD
jgi:AcrR family transcriptional regulator